MAEPALYILTRDGQTERFHDPWGGVFLFRELVWGPESFEHWARQLTPANTSQGLYHAGAIVDFDSKSLQWHADYDVFRSDRRQAAHDQLLKHAWAGYEIKTLSEASWHVAAGIANDEAGNSVTPIPIDDAILAPEEISAVALNQPTTSVETPLSWISLQEASGSSRHFLAWQITNDILTGDSVALEKLTSLPASIAPTEQQVGEGVTIDRVERSITAWGGRSLSDRVKQLSTANSLWTLTWDNVGYEGHCRRVGEEVVSMSDAEMVASFLPYLLCARRFDVESYLEAMRSRILGRLRRIASFMALFLGIPLVGLGIASGTWAPAIILGFCLALAWPLAQRQARRWIRHQQGQARQLDASAVSAGPTQLAERRSVLGRLLEQSDLPWNAEVESRTAGSPWMKLMNQQIGALESAP